ncbi:MAG TPA: (deoxy)nucleoside triphosphate pyrophosphohydrolase [Desulfurivibrionaceae bacterium]|nr:(deoxy)nucleoside triphosphate pyrophosphohydrolase [Desulfurivibrionaceae bacterium]
MTGLSLPPQPLQVSCAIIERQGLVLAAQRSAVMSHPGKWEFPGGKIVPGESAAEGLRREILEELGVELNIGRQLPPHTHRYPALTVSLYPFVCTISTGEPVLHEHQAIIWSPPAELSRLDWAEADLPVLAAYLAKVNNPSPDSAATVSTEVRFFMHKE